MPHGAIMGAGMLVVRFRASSPGGGRLKVHLDCRLESDDASIGQRTVPLVDHVARLHVVVAVGVLHQHDIVSQLMRSVAGGLDAGVGQKSCHDDGAHMQGIQLRLEWCVLEGVAMMLAYEAVSYTHLRAHETVLDLVCR